MHPPQIAHAAQRVEKAPDMRVGSQKVARHDSNRHGPGKLDQGQSLRRVRRHRLFAHDVLPRQRQTARQVGMQVRRQGKRCGVDAVEVQLVEGSQSLRTDLFRLCAAAGAWVDQGDDIMAHLCKCVDMPRPGPAERSDNCKSHGLLLLKHAAQERGKVDSSIDWKRQPSVSRTKAALQSPTARKRPAPSRQSVSRMKEMPST